MYARMRRRTDRQASVPLFTKRTISMQGTLSMTILASTFSSSQGAPYEVPCTCRAYTENSLNSFLLPAFQELEFTQFSKMHTYQMQQSKRGEVVS